MAPVGFKQEVHRPGPLKQSNKPHKGCKSNGRRQMKGKMDVKAVTHHKRHEMKKTDRKNQIHQLRKTKREDLRTRYRLGGLDPEYPPYVAILSLDDTINASDFLERLEGCSTDLIVTKNEFGASYINSPRLKRRYMFLKLNKYDLHSVMDALKVCGILLMLHSSNPLDEYTDSLLSIIMAHALPTTIHVAQGMSKLNPKKKAEFKKIVQKSLETRFSDIKLHPADNNQELQLLLRQIGSQKQRLIKFRDNRAHLLVDSMMFEPNSPDSNIGILAVNGYMRGQTMNVNGLVHLPGYGTYQIKQFIYGPDPHNKKKDNPVFQFETSNERLQESLKSEITPDPMEGEQTWPTQEELDEAESDAKRGVKTVAVGTSDYQAAWIVESESDDSDIYDEDSPEGSFMISENENDEEIENEMDITDSASEVQDDNYDKNIDFDEEKQTLVRFKEERMNQMFPDEEDTPRDIEARKRYQKYRGLKSYHKDPWDPMENLPEEYGRIFRFQNFKQTKKNVVKLHFEGANPGVYTHMYLKDVPKSVYDAIDADKSLLIAYGLLPHEQKMSVVNTLIRKHPSCQVPIKSKDTLIFHVGFRRFTCKPIFSEHKSGNKFKLERFLPTDSAAVASFYAPVTFPPAPVVVFRQKPNGSHQLVATGSVLDVDPNRVVVKRVILSGHPLRINRRSAIVRFMFFNREDIEYFKSVELRTKYARQGHIREALGSHGHMKCVFDKQLQSQDIVLMNLYKRVYPKWSYDDYVPTPVCAIPQKTSSAAVMDTTA